MQIGPARIGQVISEWSYAIAEFWNPEFRYDTRQESWEEYERNN